MTATGTRTDPQSVQKNELSQDVLPWEQQPFETEAQYAAFVSYRDSDDRKVANHGGSSAYKWSSWNQWAVRVYQWDLHRNREEDEQLVRYRLGMNRRHRSLAARLLEKLTPYVEQLDLDELKPNEFARLVEMLVKIEREAAGLVPGAGGMPTPPPADSGSSTTLTLGELLGANPEAGAKLARQVHLQLRQAGQ